MQLKDKRVLITAAATGIGREMVNQFAEAGAKLFVSDIDGAALGELACAHPEVGCLACDAADTGQVDSFVDQALAALGGVDVLVNNVGIAGETAPIEEMDPEAFDRVFTVNVGGHMRPTRRVVPHMKRAGAGSIINVSSLAGKLAMPLRTPYAASKWAVLGFTQTLAAELGAFGIRVNAILPGPVAGPRVERAIADKARARGVAYKVVEQEYLNMTSMRKMIDPADIASMAVYLASDAARSVSGQFIGVDGDGRLMV